MKYFSMFSGIGGFEYGIEKAFSNKQTQRGRSIFSTRNNGDTGSRKELWDSGIPTCIGFSETDRYAKAIYRKHYPNHKDYGDATAIDVSELEDFDILVGGFPCQTFSIAGKRAGFLDTRGTLFFEIARILSAKRPGYFLLENVAGLLSHDSRKTFQSIIGVLTDLGYTCEWQLLNSKDYGVPQNRERIFIAGCLGKRGRPEVFPIAEGHGENHESVTSTAIDRNYWKGADNHAQRTMIQINEPQSQGYRVYDTNGLASTLAGEAGGVGAKTGLYMVPSITANDSRKGYSGQNKQFFEKTGMIRRLTPTECERLQGFPPGWTEYGIDEDGKEIKISDTQRYKVLGNAVTTNVIQKIMERICAR